MGKYSYEFELASYMADSSKSFRLQSFMSVLQEMALKAAEPIGFGYDAMQKYNAVWVLSRMHIKFFRVPKWREQLKIQTWHKGVDGLQFLRDFELFDAEGNVVAAVTTTWLIMNTVERRLMRPDTLSEIIPAEPQDTSFAIEEHPGKVIVPRDLVPEKIGEHTVSYSDTDFVGHTNNTKYIEWVENFLPEVAEGKHASDILINFNQETHLGESVDIMRVDKDGKVIAVIMVGGRPSFTAEFTF